MAPTIRSVSTGFSSSSSATTTVTKPTGLAVGDLMIAYHGGEADTTGLTVPSGWTSQRFIAGGGSSNYPAGRLLTKVATSTDVSASSFSFVDVGGNGDGVVILLAITTGTYNTTTPLTFSDTTWFSQARVSSNVQSTRTITSVDNSLGLFLLGSDTNGVTQSYPSSGPTGTTLQGSRQSATLFSLIGIYSQVLSGTGTVAAKTVTPTGAAGQNGWIALTVIVQPPAVTAPSGANAGADATVTIGDAFSRTATVSGTVDTHAWTVVSAPSNARETAGQTLATTAALTDRLSTAGSYTLRYTATNAGGSSSDDVIVTVNGGSGSLARWNLVINDRDNPTTGDLAIRDRLITTLGYRIAIINSASEAEWAGTAYEATFIYAGDVNLGATIGTKYGQSTKPVFHGENRAWGLNGMAHNDGAVQTAASTTNITRFTTQQIATSLTGVNADDTTSTSIYSTSTAHRYIQNVYLQNNPNSARNNHIVIARRDAIPYWTTIIAYEQGVLDQAGVSIKGRRIGWHLTEPAVSLFSATGANVFAGLLSWLLSTPGVGLAVGADAVGIRNATFSRTAVESANGLTITAREWKILPGSQADGNTVISTSASFSYTPPLAGDYVLRYTVTVTGGTQYYIDLKFTAAIPANPDTVSYRYYRFQPLATRDNTVTVTQLNEVRFFNGFTEVATTPTVTNPGGTNPSGEEPSFAGNKLVFDKWTNTANIFTAPLVFDFGVATPTTHYIWHTAWDFATRDPISWTLEGSNNGTSWTLIDSETSYATTSERQAPVGTFVMGVPNRLVAASEYNLSALTESVSLVQTLSISTSDTYAFTDVSTLSLARALNDTFAFTDVISALQLAIATSETFTWSELAIITETLSKTATDNFSWSDIATLVASQSLTVTDTFVFTDVVNTLLLSQTATDAVGFSDASAIAAALATNETTLFTDVSALARVSALNDSVAFSDASAIAATLASSDSVPFTDVSALTLAFLVSDAFASSDVSAIAAVLSTSETTPFTDVSVLARISALTDTFSATEALSIAANLTLSDTAPFTDTSAVALATALTDTFSFTETYALFLATSLSDSYTATDVSATTQSYSATDQFAFVDTAVLQIQTNEFTASDAFAFTDASSLAQTRVLSLSDTFALTDTSAISATTTAADSFAPNDVVTTLAALLTGNDSATVTDALSLAQASAVADSFAFTDATSALARVSALSDSTSFTDASALAIARVASDAFLFSEAISATITASLSDTYVFTDIYTLFQGVNPSTSDYYPSTDIASIAALLSISDAFVFTDTSSLVASQTLNRNDTFVLTEAVSISVVATRSDAFSSTDTTTSSANLTATDIAIPTDTASINASFSRADNFAVTDSSLLFVEVIRQDSADFTDEDIVYSSVISTDDTVNFTDEETELSAWLTGLDSFDPFTEDSSLSIFLTLARSDAFSLTELSALFVQQGAQWPVDFSDPHVSGPAIDIDDPNVVSRCGNPGSATPTSSAAIGASVTENAILFDTAVVTDQIDVEVD